MYPLQCLKWIINKVLLYNTWNSAQCYVPAWIEGAFGEEWTHVYAWLSPFTVDWKLLQHDLLMTYTPIQNKNFNVKNLKAIAKNITLSSFLVSENVI